MNKWRTIVPYLHLNISLLVIYILGTWPPRGNYRFFYIVYTICSFSFILGILLIVEIANLVINWKDISVIIAGTSLFMTNCIHASKILILLCRQSRIQALLATTNSSIFNRNNITHQDILRIYTWKGIFHHIAYQSFGAVAVLCWGITPITDLIANRPRKLPIEGWYPYNVTRTPAFEITVIHQAISITIACCHNVAVDTLITGLIIIACCQLTILEKNIISIGTEKHINSIENDKSKLDKIEKENYLLYEQLKQCAIHNNIIFRFIKEIEDIFGSIIFLQLLSNCVIICLIAFNLSQMTVYIPAVLIGLITYLCCMTYQIFIYCWHGNELRLHSLRIVTATYSTNWISSTKEFKRILQIIMIRAHRPFTLSAGNIILLSLDTFVQILRMSYSIFTVLRSSTNY